MSGEYGGWERESSWTLDSVIAEWLSAGRVQRGSRGCFERVMPAMPSKGVERLTVTRILPTFTNLVLI